MPGATPLRESACRVSKTEGFLRFLRFFLVGCTPLKENEGRVSKTEGFCAIFLVGCTPLRENEGRVSKTGRFLRFWGSRNCPENCAHDSFCLIFERGKMSENRQKTSKTGGFWRFFRVRSNPLRESGCRVSKTGVFLRFWCARICAHDSFCLIRPCPDPVPR